MVADEKQIIYGNVKEIDKDLADINPGKLATVVLIGVAPAMCVDPRRPFREGDPVDD